MSFEFVPIALAGNGSVDAKDLLNVSAQAPSELNKAGKKGIGLVKWGALVAAVAYIFGGIAYYLLKSDRENSKAMLAKGIVGFFLVEFIVVILLWLIS
jgi:hypothetical protein